MREGATTNASIKYKLLCAVLILFYITSCQDNIESNQNGKDSVENTTHDLQPFQYIPKSICSASPNNLLKEYSEESRSKGIRPIKSIEQISKYLTSKKLLSIPDNSWSYMIRKSPNSYRFLTPGAFSLLQGICNEFMVRKANTPLWNLRPVITSLLRTREAISKIDNDSKSNNSSHLNGTTFDISCISFVSETGDVLNLKEDELNYLKELLACVVEDFRSIGKCYKTFERGKASKCIHIVSRK